MDNPYRPPPVHREGGGWRDGYEDGYRAGCKMHLFLKPLFAMFSVVSILTLVFVILETLRLYYL